jgi:hypothetical protein
MNCGSNLRISERKVNFRETAWLSYQLISQVSIIAFCIDLSGLLSWTVELRQMLTCSGDSLNKLHQTTLGRRLGAGLFTHAFNQYPLPMNVPCGTGEPTKLAADQRSASQCRVATAGLTGYSRIQHCKSMALQLLAFDFRD